MINGKEIRDYLHLYLGCEVTVPTIANDEDWEGYTLFSVCPEFAKVIHSEHGTSKFNIQDIKPILRPLSDLSNKEQSELQLLKEQMEDDVHNSDLEIFAVLGNKCRAWNIDIDGLIEAGLAIDINEINKTVTP